MDYDCAVINRQQREINLYECDESVCTLMGYQPDDAVQSPERIINPHAISINVA